MEEEEDGDKVTIDRGGNCQLWLPGSETLALAGSNQPGRRGRERRLQGTGGQCLSANSSGRIIPLMRSLEGIK